MKHLTTLLLALLVSGGCAARPMEFSQKVSKSYQIDLSIIEEDYSKLRSYKAEAKNLENEKYFHIGNMTSSADADYYAVVYCENLYKSRCVLTRSGDIAK